MSKGKAKNRPKVKSKKKTSPLNKLGWGEGNKNITTLRNLEKAIDEEKDLTKK